MLDPIQLAVLPTRSKPLHLWLLTGGMSPEHEVSIASATTALRHFEPGRCVIRPVYITREGDWVLAPGPMPVPFDQEAIEGCLAEWKSPKRAWRTLSLPGALEEMARDRAEGRLDLAFIIMHGEQGEDGQIQALLSAMGVPHTGSDAVASALCMDKRRTQTMLRLHGLPVPPFLTLETGAWARDPRRLLDAAEGTVGFPCVLKPLRGGSSVGVQFPENRAQLSTAASAWFSGERGPLLCEKKIVGRELTCGVLDIPGAAGWRPEPLAPTEIRPLRGTFFDYHCKYTPGASEEITPAALPGEETDQIQALAVRTHEIMGCRGFSRTDFMCDEGGVWILEINTIPGMTPTSLLPQGADARGIDYETLLTLLTESALSDLSK